jgi:uncharacterized protein YndB with AHSA1/START domain
VIIEQAIVASAARIWRACSSSSGLRSWQADEVVGEAKQGAELVLGWPALGVEVQLEVERVEEQRRIVLAAEDSRLELAVAEGRIQLTHEADFDDDEHAGTESSWRLALATLAHYLEHHEGQSRHVHWAVSPAKASVEDAHAFFTLSAAQGAWLTRGDNGRDIAAVGSEVKLDLAWGKSMTGQVLAHTPPRDLLLSWRETNQSLLALRTLPSPSAEHERLLIATWSSWGFSQTDAIAENLDAALTRLAGLLARRASA